MQHVYIEKKITIPDNIDVTVKTIPDGKCVIVKGPKGELVREFRQLRVHIEKEGNVFRVFSYFGKKKEASMVGTIIGHVNNMIKGVTEGFKYTVRIITSHFPATAEVKKEKVLIKNLYGRKDPIVVPIPFTDIDIKLREDEFIDITGIDIEKVSQMAASLAEKSRLRGKKAKDPIKFQDGLYVVYP